MRSTEAEREKKRFFAIASVGKGRWYWVVWPSLEETRTAPEPLLTVGDGYEPTKARAVEQALNLAGPRAEWISAKYARQYHHSRTGANASGPGPSAPSGAAAPTLHEFLYRDIYDPHADKWVSTPHRVVSKTRKYIFVEQQPYSPDQARAGWLDREPPTYRLDREMLEQEGYAFISETTPIGDSEQPMFYRSELPSSAAIQLECLQVLQLSWPCTLDQVKEAYRRLVKTAHPDGGGSQEQFLALQSAYEQALKLCASTT